MCSYVKQVLKKRFPLPQPPLKPSIASPTTPTEPSKFNVLPWPRSLRKARPFSPALAPPENRYLSQPPGPEQYTGSSRGGGFHPPLEIVSGGCGNHRPLSQPPGPEQYTGSSREGGFHPPSEIVTGGGGNYRPLSQPPGPEQYTGSSRGGGFHPPLEIATGSDGNHRPLSQPPGPEQYTGSSRGGGFGHPLQKFMERFLVFVINVNPQCPAGIGIFQTGCHILPLEPRKLFRNYRAANVPLTLREQLELHNQGYKTGSGTTHNSEN